MPSRTRYRHRGHRSGDHNIARRFGTAHSPIHVHTLIRRRYSGHSSTGARTEAHRQHICLYRLRSPISDDGKGSDAPWKSGGSEPSRIRRSPAGLLPAGRYLFVFWNASWQPHRPFQKRQKCCSECSQIIRDHAWNEINRRNKINDRQDQNDIFPWYIFIHGAVLLSAMCSIPSVTERGQAVLIQKITQQQAVSVFEAACCICHFTEMS